MDSVNALFEVAVTLLLTAIKVGHTKLYKSPNRHLLSQQHTVWHIYSSPHFDDPPPIPLYTTALSLGTQLLQCLDGFITVGRADLRFQGCVCLLLVRKAKESVSDGSSQPGRKVQLQQCKRMNHRSSRGLWHKQHFHRALTHVYISRDRLRQTFLILIPD